MLSNPAIQMSFSLTNLRFILVTRTFNKINDISLHADKGGIFQSFNSILISVPDVEEVLYFFENICDKDLQKFFVDLLYYRVVVKQYIVNFVVFIRNKMKNKGAV